MGHQIKLINITELVNITSSRLLDVYREVHVVPVKRKSTDLAVAGGKYLFNRTRDSIGHNRIRLSLSYSCSD